MNGRGPVIGLAVAGALLLFFPAAGAGGDGLQKVIDDAPAGSTLTVPPGVYEGNIVLARRISLVGLGRPVLRGAGEGSVVSIIADSCRISGFVIERSGPMLVDEDSGILVKSSGNTIEGNDLRDILFGIYLYHAERNLVGGNRITGRRELDVGERGSGIHVWNSERNRFIGNTITDARDGFYIQNASNTWIERNEAYGVRYGLHYMYADSNVFLENQFHHNVAGAAVMYSRGIVMRKNVVSHNRGFSSFGILFQDCHGLTADSNVISDNVVGMFFEASTDNAFRHNIIALNDVALQLFQNSVNNVFAGNAFIDNLSPLVIVGKRTESRWNEGERGNYWTGYDGYDLDGDGVGDVPMRIQNVFQYLEGREPAARLYLYSPASQALAAAGKAFPVIPVTEEVDRFPLMTPPVGAGAAAARTGRMAGEAGPHGPALLAIPLVGFILAGMLYRRLARVEGA